MTRGSFREAAHQVRGFVRRISRNEPEDPVPPPLPPGRVVRVKDRGEMFVRQAEGAGGGPSVVLLHGWALSAELNWFSGVFDAAARHGPVIAPDIRGHGRGLRSEMPFTLEAAADDVTGLIETLDAGPAVLVGYSMGGSLALLCAGRRPELVSGLVLVSTGLQWRADLWERALWAGMAVVEYGLRFGAPRGLTERYLRSAVEQSPDLQPYQGWVKAEVRRGDASDIGHAGKALANFDARELSRGIDVPTAVVVTLNDRLIRSSRQRRLAEAISGADTIEVVGAHNAWLIHPREFSSAIDRGLGLVIGRGDGTGSPSRQPVKGPGTGAAEGSPA